MTCIKCLKNLETLFQTFLSEILSEVSEYSDVAFVRKRRALCLKFYLHSDYGGIITVSREKQRLYTTIMILYQARNALEVILSLRKKSHAALESSGKKQR